jgi:peptide/nickel transport system substrate-binding protein
MTSHKSRIAAAMLAMLAVLALVIVSATAGAQDSGGESAEGAAGAEGEDNVLRIGWGQDPQTLNPFVGLDEEAYTVWAMTWDLLVNYDPQTMDPAPGIAESWEVSDDKKTVTFTLADRKWSDGEPITSEDVKYSLEVLGSEGDLFTSYTNNVTSIETPDEKTVVIETKRPDARIVGGLFIYMLPEHVWGEVPLEEVTTKYQPELPMVGSGPFIVTEFERGRILTLEPNPEWEGEQPNFDEIQFIKYGNEDAVERALQLGDIDMDLEVQPSTFESIGSEENIETVRSSSPSYTELAFNLCSAENCPDAEFNPAVQDVTVRQAIAHAIDRERINEISALGTSFPGDGILPPYYEAFYQAAEPANEFDPELANQMLDDAGWTDNGDGPRTKGDQELSFDLYVRSESQSDIQAARLVEEMGAEIGVEFNVQVVSVGKLTELTVQKVDGKPAPAFDTFIWGWGGDPYDPSFLLSLFTTSEIGASSDSFYSNPEYDRLFNEQAGEFDTETRKDLIAEMVTITQEDVPYVVLTYDPNLAAYRSDRLANVEPLCPAETGDPICEQVSYEPLLTLAPAEGASDSDDGGGGGSTAIIIVAAVVVLGAGAFAVSRMRKRRDDEPLEVEE